MTKFKNWKGVFYGIAYGLVSRAIFSLEDFRGDNPNPVFQTLGLMTLAFMFIVPLVVGLIVAYYNDTVTSSRKIVMMTAVFAVVGLAVFAVLSGKEGTICALMALPVFIIMALIGGFIGVRVFKRNRNKLYISAFAVLPFVIAPIENIIGIKDKIFIEHTTIEINSDANQVWDNITRVKRIDEEENNYSLFHNSSQRK